MASLGADFHGEHVRFSVDLGWQDHDIDAPRPSVTPLGAVPLPPDASSNFAQPWTFSEEHDVFGVFRGEYNFSDDAKVGWPRVYAMASSTTSCQTRRQTRWAIRRLTASTTSVGTHHNQRNRRALGFETGFIKHKVSASGSISNSIPRTPMVLGLRRFQRRLVRSNHCDAPDATYFTGGVCSSPKTTSRAKTASVALADMMSSRMSGFS